MPELLAPPTLPTTSSRGEPRVILPEGSTRPWHLLWAWVLPQLLLLILNLHGAWLAWGEMSTEQHHLSWRLGALEVAGLLGASALVLMLSVQRRRLTWPWHLGLLAAAAGYLWYFTASFERLLPAAVTLWILPPQEVLGWQFTFVMPATFFALLQLACTPRRTTWGADVALSGAALVGIPCLGWLLAQTRVPFGAVSITLGAAGSLCLVLALLRVVALLYLRARRTGVIGYTILAAVLGLAAPLGGLWLNHTIPFPWDFQAPAVYAFAALNGLLLCLPFVRHPGWQRALWLGQCSCFPFTFYFFLVFLPWLPLAIVAVVIMGAGFLMLAPTTLLLLHGERLRDGFQLQARRYGIRQTALCGLGALLLVPAWFTAEAVHDRIVLNRALSYAYENDLRLESRFTGSPAALARCLARLRERKAGLQLPFLSDYYQWIVFRGLVLSDDKIEHLHRLFLGGALPELKGEPFFPLISRGRENRRWRNQVINPAQNQSVRLAKKEAAAPVATEGAERTRVALTMHNDAQETGELVLPITVPDGVLVSDFALKIGDHMVPGRIFEKKTALWVYQKIRDVVRRDPGLLLFTGPNRLELRVFPVNGGETREVEVEFLYPAGLAPEIGFGGEKLALGQTGPGSGSSLAEINAETEALVFPGDTSGLPHFQREPYFHLIVERSAAATEDAAVLTARLRELARLYPQVREYTFTLANYEFAATPPLRPIGTAMTAADLRALPRRGGFAAGRAVKKAALWDKARETPEQAPLMVVLRTSTLPAVEEEGLAAVAPLLPDTDGALECSADGRWEWVPWDGPRHPVVPGEPAFHAVAVVRRGTGPASAAAINRSGPALLLLHGGEMGTPLTALTGPGGTWQEIQPAVTFPSGSPWSSALAVWQQGLEHELNPGSSLRSVVEGSRQARVLVPASSFIVVENSAQWKALSEAERAKLGGNHALDLEDTPEPGSALLLGAGATLFGLRRLRRRPAAHRHGPLIPWAALRTLSAHPAHESRWKSYPACSRRSYRPSRGRIAEP